MSVSKIQDLLTKFHDEIMLGVDKRLKEVNDVVSTQQDNSPVSFEMFNGNNLRTYNNGKYVAFCYALEGSTDRQFWQLPKD